MLQYCLPRIEASDIVQRLELQAERYFVISAHREENIETEGTFGKLVDVINMLALDHEMPVTVSTHAQKSIAATGATFHPLVRLLKPLGFLDSSAKAVLSDSGTRRVIDLEFPALNLREAHERPEGMEEAVVMMVGLETRARPAGAENSRVAAARWAARSAPRRRLQRAQRLRESRQDHPQLDRVCKPSCMEKILIASVP